MGGNTIDNTGEILLELIDEHALVVQNKGETPTFVRGESRSYLDITLTSEKISEDIISWEVSDEENLSLHQDILYTINNGCNDKVSTMTGKNGWIFCKQQIPYFLKEFEVELNKMDQNLEAEQVIVAIKEAANCTFRRYGRKLKRNSVYWQNDNIKDIRKSTHIAKRKLTRVNKNRHMSETEENLLTEEYKKKRTILKKAINNAKQHAW